MAIPKPVVTQQMRSADPEVANFIETTDVPGAAFYLWNKLRDKASMVPGFHFPFQIQRANDAVKNAYTQIKSDPVSWTASHVSVPITQSLYDAAARGVKIPDNAFIPYEYGVLRGGEISKDVGQNQVEYLLKNNFDINKLSDDVKPLAFQYKLSKQILDQGLTGKWTGEGFGSAKANADAMAKTLLTANITDISQFGKLPDGGYGNKATGQSISTDYNRANGNIFAGTYLGEDSTGFGVQFGPDGTPYFYTQQGASTSSMGDIVPILAIGLSLFAPGIGSAIGTALGLTGTAAAVVGSAVVQGVLAEAQGGDFLDGAIKGAVTAGVAPVVANNVGSVVSDLMVDSAFKNVITNAVASSASSAVTAALTGGDVESAALTGALAGAGGSIGRELGTAAELGTTPFSEQTQMLAGQEQGLGTAGGLGSNIGQAAGAIAGGVDPQAALLQAASKSIEEQRPSRFNRIFGRRTATEPAAETPVLAPTEAEITTVPPPETGQITDTGVMDGVAGTIPEITPPSTQEIPIPDQISQELGGIQEGVAGTIPDQDQQIIDLITQPPEATIPGVQEGIATTIPEGLAPPDAIPELAPPDMGVQEGIVETIPEDLGLQGGIVETIPEDLGLQGGIVETIPEDLSEDPLLGLSSAEVGLGEQEAIDRQALEGLSDASVGLGEEAAIDQANLDALGDLSSAEVGQGEQDAIDRQALEELSSAEVGQGEQDAIDAAALDFQTTPYIRDIYISSGRRQPVMGPTVTTLGQALAPPLFPSSPVSGLTSYRGAGEIESKSTGKPRRDVWNEASLRLKDALGL